MNIEVDARQAFDTLRAGGIAILPMDVGYSLIGGSTPGLDRIFSTKQRAESKLNAMLGDRQLSLEVHELDARQREIVDAITVDHDLPLGLIAPARMDHPVLLAMDDRGLSRSSLASTICMLLNAGRFHAAICRLSHEHGHPLFGSSANKSMQGTKFRVEDIEPDIRQIADVIVDYGLRKYHHYAASSTLLDIVSMKVVRVGSCYELISDVLQRFFKIELPPAPPRNNPVTKPPAHVAVA
jgi:tRNA A37 threonylcarbamoyladenosine synthetase subunit TsaC/SUA5/YrdC